MPPKGSFVDAKDVAAALAIALSIEGVTCHPK
jgi:hypothetical protein